MPSYIIEAEGVVKEAFTYAQALTKDSEYALGQYARAIYGESAQVRRLNQQAHALLMLYGPELFVGKPVPTDSG